MSRHKPSATEIHGSHIDNQNEAAIRLRTIAGLEDHARTRMMERIVRVLVQRPDEHHFHEATVRERVSPRRAMDVPDRTGADDIGGFGLGFVC